MQSVAGQSPWQWESGGGAKAVGLQSPHSDHWVTLLLPQLSRGFEAIG